MKQYQYIEAKNAIEQQIPISQETYDSLVALRDQHQEKINELFFAWDVDQALYLNRKKMEINELISKAIIA